MTILAIFEVTLLNWHISLAPELLQNDIKRFIQSTAINPLFLHKQTSPVSPLSGRRERLVGGSENTRADTDTRDKKHLFRWELRSPNEHRNFLFSLKGKLNITDSRIGHVRYIGKILKKDMAQDQPLRHCPFSWVWKGGKRAWRRG